MSPFSMPCIYPRNEAEASAVSSYFSCATAVSAVRVPRLCQPCSSRGENMADTLVPHELTPVPNRACPKHELEPYVLAYSYVHLWVFRLTTYGDKEPNSAQSMCSCVYIVALICAV